MPVRNLNLSAEDREKKQSVVKTEPRKLLAEEVDGGMTYPQVVSREITPLYFRCDTPEEQDHLITFINNNVIVKSRFPAFTFKPDKLENTKDTIVVVNISKEEIQHLHYDYDSYGSHSKSSASSPTKSDAPLDKETRDFIFFIEKNFSGLIEEFLTRFTAKNSGKYPDRTSVTLIDIASWANGEPDVVIKKPRFFNPFVASIDFGGYDEFDTVKHKIGETTLRYLKEDCLSILKEMEIVSQNATPGKIREHDMYNQYMRRLTIGATRIARRTGNIYKVGLLVSTDPATIFRTLC
jgi:hypothetical protein